MPDTKFYQQLDVVALVAKPTSDSGATTNTEKQHDDVVVSSKEEEACRAYFAAVNRLFIEKILVGESGVICGLHNNGNTCYFGSGFQALLACSQFLSLLRLTTPTMTGSVAGAPLVNGMSFSAISNSAGGTIPYTLPIFPSHQFESAASTSTTQNKKSQSPPPSLPATKRAELASVKKLKDLPVIGDAHTWVNLATKGLFNRPLPGEDPRAPIPAGSEGGVPTNPDQHHFPVWSEFMSLAQQMRFAGNESAISPIVCIGTLSKVHPGFTMMMQHDSSEMVHQLLSSMNDASRVDARSEDLWNIYHQQQNIQESYSLSQSFSSSFLGERIFQLPRIPSLATPANNYDDGETDPTTTASSSSAPVSLSSLRALQVLALQNRINLENTAREGVEAERKAGRTLRDGSSNARLLDRFQAAGRGKYVAPKLFNSHLTDPFTGSTLSAITCGSCGSCSRTYQSFNTLPLSIPKMITRARYAALHPEYVAMRRTARDYEAGEAKRAREARYEGTAKALGRDPVEFAESVSGDSTGTAKKRRASSAQGWGSILLTAIPDNTVARAVIASTQLAKIAFSTPPLSWVSKRLRAFPERVQRRFPKRLQGAISGLSSIRESAYWWLFVGDEEVPYTDYINADTGKPYDTSEVDYPLTLDECLRIHFGLPETLKGDNTYRCEVCGTKGTSMKETKLLTTPKYFIIQLMRFGSGGGRKDGTDVVFPMGTADSTDGTRKGYLEMPLDLLPHCATGLEGGHAICLGGGGGGSSASSSSSASAAQNLLPQDVTPLMPPLRAEYTLASVINHHGAHIDGGHYTACSRRRFVGDATATTSATTTSQLEGLLGEEKRISSEVWLHLDDSVFTQITRADAINTEGYMLVYERDESRPLGSVAMEMALSEDVEDEVLDNSVDNTTSTSQSKHSLPYFYNSDSIQIVRDYFGLDCRFEETTRRGAGGGSEWINLKRDLRHRMLQSTAAEVRAQMIARAMLMDPRMTSGVPTTTTSSNVTPMFSRGWLATAATTLEPGPVLTHPTTASSKTLSDAGGLNRNLISDPSLRKLWYLAGTSQHPYLPLLQFATGVFEEVFTGSSNIA